MLRYDLISGKFYWKVNGRGNDIRIGKYAGCKDLGGYVRVNVDGKSYNRSRLAWLYIKGSLPTKCIDHIDGNRANDTWSNLREVSMTDNNRNKAKYSNNKSGVTGVSFNKKSSIWVATISLDGKQKILGCFKDKDEAIYARLDAEKGTTYHANHGRV
tara:strand:- start:303 stop:773 length:471 start_codon:yes stop_codon:yes gene_type:complete